MQGSSSAGADCSPTNTILIVLTESDGLCHRGDETSPVQRLHSFTVATNRTH